MWLLGTRSSTTTPPSSSSMLSTSHLLRAQRAFVVQRKVPYTSLFSRHLFTVVFGLSVRCTISLPSLAEKRSSRLACQDTAPSAGTSSPYLDVQASLGDTSSLNSVRPRLSYLLRAPTDSQRDAPSPNGYSSHSSVPRGRRKKAPQANGRSGPNRPHGTLS